MNHYISRKFPQHFAAIQALEAKDEAFSDACSDYEEICTWLATQEQPTVAADLEEVDQARELQRDLADEILNLLEIHRDITK